MAIAHDANTRFPTTAGTSDTTTGDRTFTHTPVGIPKCAIVAVCVSGNTTFGTGVLYGGQAMSLVVTGTDVTEQGIVSIYVLTNLIGLSGAQTVTLQGCIAAAKIATCSTVTAATSTTRVNASNSFNTTTSVNPTISTTTTRGTCSYGALHTGNNAVGTAGTGTTQQHNIDYGVFCAQTFRRTASNEAAGTISINVTIAASEDHAMAMVSIAEQFDIDAQPTSYAETGFVTELVGPSFEPPGAIMARFRS